MGVEEVLFVTKNGCRCHFSACMLFSSCTCTVSLTHANGCEKQTGVGAFAESGSQAVTAANKGKWCLAPDSAA
eukprot:3555751-Pleurochrysis_carterae.AAC.1